MFEVGDPISNMALTILFIAMVVVSLLSVLPWRLIGVNSRWPLYLPAVWLAGYLTYEMVMPAAYDIRVDLLLILPLAALTLLSWLVRIVLARRTYGQR